MDLMNPTQKKKQTKIHLKQQWNENQTKKHRIKANMLRLLVAVVEE